jgi:hypothetical protein
LRPASARADQRWCRLVAWRAAGRLAGMERPATDPAKLLAQWMEWENGEVTPGRVMANLKTGGLRELLEQIVQEQGAEPAGH